MTSASEMAKVLQNPSPTGDGTERRVLCMKTTMGGWLKSEIDSLATC